MFSLFFFSSSYAKTILKKVMRYRKEKGKDTEEDDSFVRWEKDFELIPLSIHGLFFEYLELGKRRRTLIISLYLFIIISYSVWIRYYLCCCFPSCSILCMGQQRHRDSSRRSQIHPSLPSSTCREGTGHWTVVPSPSFRD